MTLTHTQTGHRPERVAFDAEAQTVKFVVPAPYRPVGAPPVSPDDAQHARIERLAAQGKANGVRVYRSRYANEWKVTSQQRDAITGARHPGYTVRLSDGRYCCECKWALHHLDSDEYGEYACVHVVKAVESENRRLAHTTKQASHLHTVLAILSGKEIPTK